MWVCMFVGDSWHKQHLNLANEAVLVQGLQHTCLRGGELGCVPKAIQPIYRYVPTRLLRLKSVPFKFRSTTPWHEIVAITPWELFFVILEGFRTLKISRKEGLFKELRMKFVLLNTYFGYVCDWNRHIQESRGPLGPKSPKSLKKVKKVPQNVPNDLKKSQKDYKISVRGLFRHFFDTPGREAREVPFETFWGFRDQRVWRLLYMGIAIVRLWFFISNHFWCQRAAHVPSIAQHPCESLRRFSPLS